MININICEFKIISNCFLELKDAKNRDMETEKKKP